MPEAVCFEQYHGASGWLFRLGSTGCHRDAHTGSGSGITLLFIAQQGKLKGIELIGRRIVMPKRVRIDSLYKLWYNCLQFLPKY
jgi:hypothetical protein